ncbi:MAG: hypothetical protein WB616_06845 [Candidatus Sulfotelmatobacter sp.]
MSKARDVQTTLPQVNISTGAVTPGSNGKGLVVGGDFNWYNPSTTNTCTVSTPTDANSKWFVTSDGKNSVAVGPLATQTVTAELESVGLGWTYGDTCTQSVTDPKIPVGAAM